MSSFEYRGRGRGRGGPPRGGGGFRGGRGGYMDRDGGGRGGGGGYRGRGGYSRGRGGPPSRSRDDMSPPRSYEISDRGGASGRRDRYEDSYESRAPMRHMSPLRDSGRSYDRHSSPPPRRERDFPPSRHTEHSRDYLPPRSFTPPPASRDTGYSSYKDSFSSSRDDRRAPRDYPPRSTDYGTSSRRDFSDAPPRRESYSSRDYPPARNGGSDFRDSMSSRDFRDSGRDFRDSARGGDRYADSRPKYEDRPPRDSYGGRGRGRGLRSDRGSSRGYMNGSRGSRGGPRGRGRDFSGGRDRRSLSREGAGGKRPRLDAGDYRR